MFLKVTIVSIMAICAAGNPVYLQQQNHAISSQSFHRHDVPISYNYSSIHVYTTPNPEQNSDKPKNQLRSLNFYQAELDPVQFKRIQYAPVRVKVPNPSIDVVSQDEYSTKEPIRKDHLEPRNLAPNYFESLTHKFIPGHNVEVLQTLRSPAHDAIYRSFPGSLHHHNFNKIKNLHNHIVYRQHEAEQQPTPTTQTPIDTKVTTTTSPFIAVTPQLVAIPNNFRINHEPFEPQHAKIQGLLLNVARVYNVAQMSEKASDNINPFMKSLNRDPSQTRAIIYNNPHTKQLSAPSQQKTYLYPIQNVNRPHDVTSHNVYH